VKARSYYEYAMHHLKPLWFEQSPHDIWSATVCSIKEIMSSPQVNSQKVDAVCFSTQGGTLIPVDSQGTPVRPAITWLDKRAAPQCSTLIRIIGSKSMLEICGREPIPAFMTPKMLWLKENEPDTFRRTEKFLQVQDFIIMRLTGKYVTDLSNTSFLESIIFDAKKTEWSKDILSLIGISEDQLPELKETGDIIGEVTREMEVKTQLPSGTLIVMGGHDQCMAAVGAGIIEPGIALLSAGTSWALLTSLESPISNSPEYFCYYHAVRGKWILLTSSTCGVALRWFRDQLGEDEMEKGRLLNKDPYDLLVEKAADVRPGSDGLIFLPFLAGVSDDLEAKGCFVGLTLAHTKGHLIRALLEGNALEVLRMTEIFKKVGMDIREYRFIGGASKSALWQQIIADTTQRAVVTLKNPEAASLGAAIIGGESVGMFKDIKEGIQKVVSINNRIEPRKKYEGIYNNKMQVYRTICKSLKPHWKTLSA
jgi:xylulokinase